MVIGVVEFSSGGYKIGKIFAQKLSIILENKVVICYQKNVNNKTFVPKLIFFNEKKMRTIPMISDIEN
jgi:hypothetical protein